MADYVTVDGEDLAGHTVKMSLPFDHFTSFRAVVDGLTRPVARAVAAQKLRAWVEGRNDVRPSRDDLKRWVGVLLSERPELLERPTEAEFDALKAQYAKSQKVITDLIGERDEVRRLLDEVRRERDDLARQLDAVRAAALAEAPDDTDMTPGEFRARQSAGVNVTLQVPTVAELRGDRSGVR
jgi:hypothetical protein